MDTFDDVRRDRIMAERLEEAIAAEGAECRICGDFALTNDDDLCQVCYENRADMCETHPEQKLDDEGGCAMCALDDGEPLIQMPDGERFGPCRRCGASASLNGDDVCGPCFVATVTPVWTPDATLALHLQLEATDAALSKLRDLIAKCPADPMFDADSMRALRSAGLVVRHLERIVVREMMGGCGPKETE